MKGIVTNEIALTLKKKGFDESCFICWTIRDEKYIELGEFWKKGYRNSLDSKVISAPTYDHVQDWLEEKHGLGIETALDNTLSWVWRITPLHPEATHQEQIQSQNVYCKGRKEALIAAIEESLKLIPYEIL